MVVTVYWPIVAADLICDVFIELQLVLAIAYRHTSFSTFATPEPLTLTRI